MKYQSVILDLDDTLYDYVSINDSAIEATALLAEHEFGIRPEDFMTAFTWARKDNKRVLGETAASHNRLLYFQKTLEYLHLPPVGMAIRLYECYWGYMLEHMTLYEGALDFLKFCKANTISIGICSDLTAHIQHRKIEKLGLIPYIDAIVTSEEAGAEKPAPQMFQMILDKLGVQASEALYVGDSYKKDVIGAEKMGIDVLWFKGDVEDEHAVLSFSEIFDKLQ